MSVLGFDCFIGVRWPLGLARLFTLRMTTGDTLFAGAAATPLRLTSEPRRGHRNSMKSLG